MESFYLLIPIALIFVALALRLLFWAINNGQYDNLDTEAHRILFDEDAQPKTASAPAADSSNNIPSSEQTGETAGAIKQTRASHPAGSSDE